MLEEMGRDAESNPCCAARDNVYLVRIVSAVLWQFAWILNSES